MPMTRIAFVTFFMGLMAALTQGCNDTSFSAASLPQTSTPDIGVIPPGGPVPPPDTSPPICDPFSNGGARDATKGVRATLHYYEVGDPRIASIANSNHFIPGVPGVVTAASPVYLNQLDVPTRAFSDGFTNGEGNLLKTMSGEPLIEWFSLRMGSNFIAPTAAEEGHYQFALHSDDGAVLKIDEGRNGNYVDLVNDDSIHAPKLTCATRTVHLKAGDPLPFKLNYFQGPRVLITLQVLWKRLPAAQSSGLSCAMGELSSIPAAAYQLEAGRTNPCVN